jgi:hypothetical protein
MMKKKSNQPREKNKKKGFIFVFGPLLLSGQSGKEEDDIEGGRIPPTFYLLHFL